MKKLLTLLISYSAICLSSCTIFQPLPLRPIENTDSVRKIERPRISEFNGDYEILSVDSSSNTLGYAFLYKPVFDTRKLPGKNDYINLSAIDDRHIKATLLVNGRKVKSKTIKGRLNNNYFEFHTNHISLKYVFIVYRKQTNRISLSRENDLFLDTNSGGIGFLLILPIPLSGSSMDTYNLKFKRKNY